MLFTGAPSPPLGLDPEDTVDSARVLSQDSLAETPDGTKGIRKTVRWDSKVPQLDDQCLNNLGFSGGTLG